MGASQLALYLWDSAGGEDYYYLRPLSYASTHVIFFFFAIDNIPSFNRIWTYWLPEVHFFCPKVKKGLAFVSVNISFGGFEKGQTKHRKHLNLC